MYILRVVVIAVGVNYVSQSNSFVRSFVSRVVLEPSSPKANYQHHHPQNIANAKASKPTQPTFLSHSFLPDIPPNSTKNALNEQRLRSKWSKRKFSAEGGKWGISTRTEDEPVSKKSKKRSKLQIPRGNKKQFNIASCDRDRCGAQPRACWGAAVFGISRVRLNGANTRLHNRVTLLNHTPRCGPGYGGYRWGVNRLWPWGYAKNRFEKSLRTLWVRTTDSCWNMLWR